MSDAAHQEISQEPSKSSISKPPRVRDKAKVHAYMNPYMAKYRADNKIARKLGLTVGQWRRQQKTAMATPNVSCET